MEITKNLPAADVATDSSSTQGLTKVVAQSPASVRNGKVFVTFKASELPGTPDALKLDGKVFPIVRQILPFNPGNGAQGGQLLFVLELPVFAKDGEKAAQIRVDNTWLPLTLNVVIAMH